ncbi:PREDICTED: formin-like protein 5 [Calidris pugnax]|uniref:formin-like protein 5 n=1 Tax=Calidris pugnax TaxID=198806 RepID=UPI00071DE310|nr:PREDICTED: formin-like protein 5 [Calidris pugnax]
MAVGALEPEAPGSLPPRRSPPSPTKPPLRRPLPTAAPCPRCQPSSPPRCRGRRPEGGAAAAPLPCPGPLRRPGGSGRRQRPAGGAGVPRPPQRHHRAEDAVLAAFPPDRAPPPSPAPGRRKASSCWTVFCRTSIADPAIPDNPSFVFMAEFMTSKANGVLTCGHFALQNACWK